MDCTDQILDELFAAAVSLLSQLKLPTRIPKNFLLTEDRKRVLYHLHRATRVRAKDPDRIVGAGGSHVALFGMQGLGKSTVFALSMYTSAILWGSTIQPIYWSYDSVNDVTPVELLYAYAYLRFKTFPSYQWGFDKLIKYWDETNKIIPIFFFDEFQASQALSSYVRPTDQPINQSIGWSVIQYIYISK
jgi:hypothetical protein